MSRDAPEASSKILTGDLYCPRCQKEVKDPLTCGDCLSTICRQCGTALEQVDELGIG
jgi:primosomal protein N'